MKQISYAEAEKRTRPGDVIAFAGSSFSSRLLFTRDGFSHVGVVVEGPALLEAAVFFSGWRLRVGVVRSPIAERCSQYRGEAYWLPLAPRVRELVDHELPTWGAWAFRKIFHGEPFNWTGGLAVVLGLHGAAPRLQRYLRRHDGRGYHCGELVAQYLRTIGVPVAQDPTTVHPADVVALNVFAEKYCLCPEAMRNKDD
jgi:hypothetical protein